ncbi:MAG: hydroxymyristoyl-ACP dehydratase [Alistipes sp.]|nr:hydroxymyristoyl-ACP dehydratase [Alistipes sp.]
MKLLDSLYSVTNEVVTDVDHSYTIKLNAEHFIYAAHFPGEPITPGVCIMQIAHELLELHLGKQLDIDIVKNVKFLRIITPTETPVVCYTLQKVSVEERLVKAQVNVSYEGDSYAKLSLVCQIRA